MNAAMIRAGYYVQQYGRSTPRANAGRQQNATSFQTQMAYAAKRSQVTNTAAKIWGAEGGRKTETDTAEKTSTPQKAETDTAQKAGADVVQKKEYPSAVADWKRRHPESASQVDGQVMAGKSVREKYGAKDVDRDSMTMEEYKAYFTDMMDSIPYEYSQQRDVNVWSITEKGWEQMKNDPDYEAWVLGYTWIDRSIHNPWASMPGYSARYHTEHFGASIDEHLGQSSAMSAPGENRGETWWEKRHAAMKKQEQAQEKRAVKKHAAARKAQEADWLKESMRRHMRLDGFLPRQLGGGRPDMGMFADFGQILQMFGGMNGSR